MLDTKTCFECGQPIESTQNVARMKNPAVGEIDYIYFHQRGRGDCYWKYLRDTIIKRQKLEQMEYQFTW